MLKKLLSVLLAAVCLMSVISGCTTTPEDKEKDKDTDSTEHEPITIMDGQRDYSELIKLVKEKYPEINIEIIPYRGRNMSAYMKQQLETGIMPDIYSSTQAWNSDIQKENLVDLTKYSVSESYTKARLGEYMIDGGVYLLPFDYKITGITCNKSLLERNNIAIPTSFTELCEVTIPALNEAGINLCYTLCDLPGTTFQYFFSIASAMYMNTTSGRAWRESFTDTSTDTYASGDANLTACIDYVGKWIDCGMLNTDLGRDSSATLEAKFKEGNTAFYIGSIVATTQSDDGTGDQYCLIPFLSEDGTTNTYITSPNRFYGLNKDLEKEGNEQKLEDALKVLEVLSSNEGYIALNGENSTNLCSIIDFEISEDSFYKDAVTMVSTGHSMNLVYTGWENYMVGFGESIYNWINGDCGGADTLAVLDDLKREVKEKGVTYYATVTEELDTVQAAQLCGQMFMEATGADAALISYNVYNPEIHALMENSYGANGHILPGKLTEENITIFLPTGWYDTLLTLEYTGEKIKAMAAEGADTRGTGYHYPYVFLTADGNELEDDKTYKVVVCGYNKPEKATLGLVDTGIVGLDAAKAYLQKVGEVSSKTLDNSLVQEID